MLPLDLNLEAIPDAVTRAAVQRLLNLVEQLYRENQALRAENQRLRDEINRLKGEQGKPVFPAHRATPKPRPPPADHSSESERREPQAWQKDAKLPRISIDRVERLLVDPALLPPDAQFKGCDPVVIQDLVLRTDNVLFLKEVYYSPSQHQTFRAALPAGYTGQFGPGIRTLALVLAYGCLVSEPQIHTLFTDAGIALSTGQVSAFLIAGHERLHREAHDVLIAGLNSSPWQHLDDTPTRVNGANQVCYTLCNPFYTAYQTRSSKARLTVLSVLQGGGSLRYRLDATAWAYLEEVGVARKRRQQVAALAAAQAPDHEWDEAAFGALLDTARPGLGPQQRQRVLEAGALAAYRAQTAVPVVDTLVCDDAPQFRKVTEHVALCWVHDGRHYTKLLPYLPCHQERVKCFRKRYWAFYRELRAYQAQPTPAEAARLAGAFDTLFGECTGLEMLDHRMALTQAKKTELLAVLVHPELPLHNNPAELGVRRRVRKRDVSFGPRTAAGAQAWDTFQTLSATAAKLGVSFFHYLRDRLSGAHQLPSLAQRIEERAQGLKLGQSWPSS
ncbi:MAG: hypothetical protein ACRDOE_07070 [Streptosporangiaceae bacterium]